MTTRQQVLDLIDDIAREWDGCEHDDSMTPDIGQAIRQAAKPRVNALFTELANAPPEVQPEAAPAPQAEAAAQKEKSQ